MEDSSIQATAAPPICDADPDSFYQYESLQGQPANTIRLLTVHPGDSEPIECSLATFNLGSKIKYRSRFQALSYMWGTQTRDRVIRINGKSFTVRPNLWSCLKRLQQSGKSTCIWIDAICVNQDDIPERNQQVPLMGRIYSQAEFVIAWLGNDPSLRPLEADFIPEHVKADRRWFWRTLLFKGEPDISEEVSVAIQSLVTSPYWNRAWIVQELVCARKFFVWFGETGVKSPTSLRRWLWVTKVDCSRNLLSILDIRSGDDSALDHFRYGLAELMDEFQRVQCSDPRDRAFAFLSLAKDRKTRGIEPDYSKTVENLCSDLKQAYGKHLQGCPCENSERGSLSTPTATTRVRRASTMRSIAFWKIVIPETQSAMLDDRPSGKNSRIRSDYENGLLYPQDKSWYQKGWYYFWYYL